MNEDVSQIRDVTIERLDGEARGDARDEVVVKAPLQLRVHGGVPVATVMRTPGHDLELVRGLLHAEGVQAGAITQVDEDAVEIDCDAAAFAGRGLLASAACGVCGRVAIADLDLARDVVAGLPAQLRAAQGVFAATGGLHAAGLFTAGGLLIAAREDVGRHNAVDKLVGWGLTHGVVPEVMMLSGRLGYELVQKAIMFRVPIVAAVSAPSSLAIELAERFGVGLVGFVRGNRANIYAHGWRLR
jgi:FdhD protein